MIDFRRWILGRINKHKLRFCEKAARKAEPFDFHSGGSIDTRLGIPQHAQSSANNNRKAAQLQLLHHLGLEP